MTYKPAKPLHEYSLLVCYTDPSFKDTKKSDYKATVLVGKWQEEFHVIKCYLEQTSTANMINWHFDMMELVGEKACYYLIEENLMHDALAKAFSEEGRKRKTIIPIRPDKRSKQDKFTRIESLLEPLNSGGKLYLNANEKDNPHMMRLEEQFLAIAPKSRAHDDGPDAVEGAVYILNNKTALLKPGSFMAIKTKENHKLY